MTDESPFNRVSLPQGAIDLTARALFPPIYRTRNSEGRWVIRYYLETNDSLNRMRNEVRLNRRDNAMDPDTIHPLDARQITALNHIIGRIEDVSLVRFERVDDPQQAQLHLLSANYRSGGLGHIRNAGSNPLQVVTGGQSYTDRQRRGTALAMQLNYNEGGVGYGTLMHELLHGIGLRHPRNWDKYRNGPNGTVMHYTGEGRGDDNALGRYDIAALQYLYGMPEHLARRAYTTPGFDTPPIPFTHLSEPDPLSKPGITR